uniref:ATP synthase F0 subunit 6 n=1 Tax=Arthurdendyus triangulatus TaxID=132421 RepID=UPI002E785B8E|nr:ATP synthase F0 subunit 6 [Arthurdendyus triangulatus]WPY71416.1 ATP synthase F0 subunit 6 [Arthurdendyus triangulatus]
MLFDVFSSLDYSYSNFSLLDSFSFPWFLALFFLILFFFNFFCFSHFSVFCSVFFFNGWIKSLNWDKFTYSLVVLFFCFFYYNNLLGLFPYVFGLTSHLFLNLVIAFQVWLVILFVSVFSDSVAFLSHLVPFGSPLVLSFFLCILETISIFIRFLTLSLRLAVNISTGHVFLSLLGGGFLSFFSSIFIFFCLCFYIIFEFFICFLQAFVFSLLVVQYFDEVSV